MAFAVQRRAAALLLCLLTLASAQNIFFGTSSSRTAGACEFGGRQGTCKEVLECPELLAHVRNRNIAALKAAKSNCGEKRVAGKSRPVPLLCCAERPPTTAPPAAKFRNHPQCGESEFSPGRIVGGEPVHKLNDFPWMAILKWAPDGDKPVYRCGGAVLNERWVLTAAHCIADNGPVSVRVRDLNLATSNEDYHSAPPVDVPVEHLLPHPEFHRNWTSPYRGLFNDIALIKLSRDLVFSEISKPLCLPKTKRSTTEYERLRTSYIAGWGHTEFAGDASAVMMWATVNITDHRDCQRSYGHTGSWVDDSEHICASGNDLKQAGCVPGADDGSCRGGVDACEGDSGGPLMERRDEFNRQRWYAIGVVSYGTGCGNPVYPGIYSRVDHFLDWIAETVAGN